MKTIEVIEDYEVLIIEFKRPEVHNAFNPEMIGELTETFRAVVGQKQLRAVVLSGKGKSFSSGADLAWMKSLVDYSLQENIDDSEALYDMFAAAYQCPVPLIAKLHGHVMGGAVGIAAVCDVVAAEEKTKFCFSEVLLGLVPAVISPFVLKKMHSPMAYELMLTGQLFETKKAYDSGLVQFIGKQDEVDGYVEGILQQLRMCGPEALRETKKLLRKVQQDPSALSSDVKKSVTRTIAERRVSDEGQEGLKGFLEKRNPTWRP